MASSDCTPVWAAGKVVGTVENSMFRKRLRGSKHLLRTPRGWALDVQSLHDAEEMGATSVEITDQESGKVYTSSIPQIRTKGVQFDRGFGLQIVLPLHFWAVGQREGRQLRLLELSPC